MFKGLAGLMHQRRKIVIGLAVFLLAAVVGASTLVSASDSDVPLYSDAVVMTSDGSRSLYSGDTSEPMIPGTRVSGTSDGARALAANQLSWLASGSIPDVAPRFDDMVRWALLDLHTLTLENGATVAGWSPNWRYVWPRDAAIVAYAFSRTGHFRDAMRILNFLDGVQRQDGLFHARYLADGSGVPDDRGVQLDGTGWALWSSAQVASELPSDLQAVFLKQARSLVDRSAAAILRMIDNEDSLPPVSSDYWEVEEETLTLGTAAPLLAGMFGAEQFYLLAGEPAAARRVRAGADRLEAAVHAIFGPDGYPRHRGGSARDAAVAFLLPPFTAHAHPDVVDAWQKAAQEMARPAGGLAPGAGWKRDGISWTPETALFGLSAAAIGDQKTAHRWLRWLDAHRTTQGALPEKVLEDGSPAAVAPLAWTAALVVLTSAELAESDESSGRAQVGSGLALTSTLGSLMSTSASPPK